MHIIWSEALYFHIHSIKFSPPMLTLILIVFADATVLNAEAFSSTAYKPELVSGIIERRRAYTRKYRTGLWDAIGMKLTAIPVIKHRILFDDKNLIDKPHFVLQYLKLQNII